MYGLKYVELQFCLLFCMGLIVSHVEGGKRAEGFSKMGTEKGAKTGIL